MDIAQIVNVLAPTPNYETQALIHANLAAGGFEKMKESIKNYGRYVKYKTNSSSELNAYGYVPNSSTGQTETAIIGTKMLVSIYPAIPFLLGVALLFFYEINKKMETQIETELKERRTN